MLKHTVAPTNFPSVHRTGRKRAPAALPRSPSLLYALGTYVSAEPPPDIFVVVAQNLKSSYLGRILHMGADAGAGIIIPDTHNPEHFRRILRQFAEVNDIGRMLPASCQ